MLLASIAALLPCAPTRAQQTEAPPSAAPRGGLHYELRIDAPAELSAALRERTLLGRWQRDPEFQSDQLPVLVARAHEEALAIAQAAGWFSPEIRISMREAASGALAEVRIEVLPGAQTRVSAFQLQLQGSADDASWRQTLQRRWPLPVGSVFRSADWDLGKRALLEQLRAQGHLRAGILESQARIDPQAASAELNLRVDIGARLRLGELRIRGLNRYPRSLIEDLRPFGEGDPYSLEALLLLQQRLQAAGPFASVTVQPDLQTLEDDPDLDRVPVLVDVVERSRQRISGGLGYSTDQGARVLLGYEHRNLLDRGWHLESGALIEQIHGRAFATLRTPQDAAGHYWQAGLRIEGLDVLGEQTRTQSIHAGRGKRSESIESFVSLQYQVEQASVDQGGGELSREHRHALTLGWAWSQRQLDSRIDPARGYSVSTHVSGASRALGSSRSFLRLHARGMRFWSFGQGEALSGARLIGLLEGGWVLSVSRDDIPAQNLFRAGGAQSVRGYRFLGLGLREGDAIVGGRVMALGSLEYQHPLRGPWWGAVFVDAGNVVDSVSQWRPAVGWGAGVRWRSPIGPVNLDLAWGQRDQRLRGHFSVGYSF